MTTEQILALLQLLADMRVQIGQLAEENHRLREELGKQEV